MNQKNIGGALVLAFSLYWAGEAGAAPRTHDGFQFRGTLGAGFLSDSESLNLPAPVGNVSGTVSGGAGVLELYAGGTPAPGVVIGGFLSGMVAPGPKVSANGASATADSNVSLNLAMIGPYIDFYPDPTTGLHVMGLLAFAQISASNGNGTVDSATSTGVGIGAGVGYDWWVADEWSLGILGRFTYAATSHETSGIKVTDNAVAPAILFSACFQ